ncbi:hypothetical protein ACLOJK_027159 [Asimina triloba]
MPNPSPPMIAAPSSPMPASPSARASSAVHPRPEHRPPFHAPPDSRSDHHHPPNLAGATSSPLVNDHHAHDPQPASANKPIRSRCTTASSIAPSPQNYKHRDEASKVMSTLSQNLASTFHPMASPCRTHYRPPNTSHPIQQHVPPSRQADHHHRRSLPIHPAPASSLSSRGLATS